MGTENQPRLRKCTDRDHIAILVADVDAIDIVDARPLGGFTLDVHLPGAPKQIEIVDVGAAEDRLQRIEYVRHIDAKRLNLFPIDVEKELGRVGAVGREDLAQRRVLVCSKHHAARHCGNLRTARAGLTLKLEFEAAASAQSDDRRQVVGENDGFRDCLELTHQPRDDAIRRHWLGLALVERIECQDQKRAVRFRQTVDQAVAHHRRHAGNAWRIAGDFLDASRDCGGAVDRSALRQLYLAEHRALVLGRQEAGRRDLEQPAGAGDDRDEDQQAVNRQADGLVDDQRISVARLVDSPQHVADQAAPGSMAGRQENRAQRRRKRQRIDRRDHHRHRNGHRELAKQLTRNARDEGNRNEHRKQHQRDGYDRRGDLLHRAPRRLGRRQRRILFKLSLDGLHHHDRIVDHDADGEH